MSEKIGLMDSVADVVVKMAKGNPGAIRVCVELLKRENGLFLVLDLDDMGIRGSSIWLGYKDFAKEDIEVFAKACRDRDPEMIRIINANGGQAWTRGRS